MDNKHVSESAAHVEPLTDDQRLLIDKKIFFYRIFSRNLSLCRDLEECFDEAFINIFLILETIPPERWTQLISDDEKIAYLVGAFKFMARGKARTCHCRRECPIEDFLTAYEENEQPDPYNIFTDAERYKRSGDFTDYEIEDIKNKIKERLSPEDYRILVSYYEEGWTAPEIGTRLGKTADAIRQRVKWLRDKLYESPIVQGYDKRP